MSAHTEALRGPSLNEKQATRNLEYYKMLGRCLLFGRGWKEFEETLEETAKEGKLEGGYVCLPIDQEHGDVAVVHAAPFSSERRVDHVWDNGADVFLWNRKDHRSSSQIHMEADSGIVEFRSLSRRSIAHMAYFIGQHREQAVVSADLLHSVTERSRSLYEQLHVDLEPIAK